MSKNPYGAYSQASNLGLTGREIEAQALEKSAQKLAALLDQPFNVAEIEEALSINGRVWALLVDGVTNTDHPLPDQMRADIMSLYLFIMRTGVSALSNSDPKRLKGIIDTNRTIASGLRATPPE